jgi:hypothetical protein
MRSPEVNRSVRCVKQRCESDIPLKPIQQGEKTSGCLMRRPRAPLADDHLMLLNALKELLEPKYELMGTVVDGRTLLKTARKSYGLTLP